MLRSTLGVVLGLTLWLLLSTVPSFIPSGTPPILATQLDASERLLSPPSLSLSAGDLRSQVVTPLEWPGEPIPAKVLMIGLKEGSFLGYAVADLGKGVTTVYRGGHLSFRVDAARGGIITSRGDALVYVEKGAHLVPGGDFTRPSLFVTPSRYVPERPSFARSMGL